MSEPTDEFLRRLPLLPGRFALRTCLVALVLVIALPSLLLAGWFAWYGIRSDRDVALLRLEEAAEILSRGFEQEIEGAANGLRGLASLGNIDSIDPALIGLVLSRLEVSDDHDVEVIRARRERPGHIMQGERSTGQIPAGLPIETIDMALLTGRVVVSNLFETGPGQGPYLAIVVPVASIPAASLSAFSLPASSELDPSVPGPSVPTEAEKAASGARYETGEEAPQAGNDGFVALRIEPRLLFRSMERPRQDGSLAALVDGNGRILARSRAQEQFIGKRVPDWARLEAIPERRGTFQAKVAEHNTDVMFGFRRVDDTPGWAVVVGEPAELYRPVWQRPVQSAVIGSLLVLALAFPLAAWLARHVLSTVKSLAGHAERVALGPDELFRPARVAPSAIREFERLRQALARADEALQARFEAERHSARALAESELRYRTLAETGALVMWRCDPAGRFNDVSGWTWLIGQNAGSSGNTVDSWYEQIDADDRAEVRMAWNMARARGTQIDTEFRLREGDRVRWVRARGAPVRDQDGGIVEWVGVLEDIDERRKAQGRVAHMTLHDHLTGLPNRSVLAERLDAAIAERVRGDIDTGFAVLFIDVDQLKLINDSLGHAFGDALLCEVSRRLGSQLGKDDVLSRVSGDEFVALLRGSGDPSAIAAVARRICDAVAAPMQLDDQAANATVTLGIAVYPRDGGSVHELLMHADAAMYQCKRAGHGRFEFFAAWMNERAERRLAIESGLRRAIQRDELVLYYQPKVSILSGRIVAMEALLRWGHPGRGMIPPNEFIPFAEESGLIDELGMWALSEACRQNRLWADSGLIRAPVAVNWSPQQLYRPGMVERVARVLADTGLPAELLELELTETALATRPEEAARVLGELSALGVVISIDDFGTGYSSLAYLRRLPLDKLKIDRAFIRELAANESDATIVQAVISMAHSLGMDVIAEGVETRAQLDRLRAMGCDEYQGYLCSRPVGATRFAEFVRHHAHDRNSSCATSAAARPVDQDRSGCEAARRPIPPRGLAPLTLRPPPRPLSTHQPAAAPPGSPPPGVRPPPHRR